MIAQPTNFSRLFALSLFCAAGLWCCASADNANEEAAAAQCTFHDDCASGQMCVDDVCQDGGTTLGTSSNQSSPTSDGTASNTTAPTSNGTADTSNGVTSNGTTATSNGTTSTSNGTTATSNGTTATSNGTTATSNGTTATSNGTTATSNGTTSECADSETVCDGLDDDCNGDIDEGLTNTCGGCGVLPFEPEQVCGTCGVYACAGQDSVRCQGERELNACGGCAVLDVVPEEECGECGEVVCDGEDAARCDDRGADACQVIRFIAMGDTGEGNANQYQVATGAQARCDALGGCAGFIMLGDNIYDEGAQSPADTQFDEKIDLPYANLKQGPPPAEGEPDMRARLPIYVTLGNHDLGGAGLNNAQVEFYLSYARTRDWFYYPDEFWDAEIGMVHLMSLHTNPLAYLGDFAADQYTAQGMMVEQALANTSAQWTIVFGHHPYRSEGRHGNAGSYEGIPGDLALLGGQFRAWIDRYVCNQADFYLSGHDHNRQWMNSVPNIPTWPFGLPDNERRPCQTHFAVSGAGAKTTDFENRGNDLAFGSEELGFLVMEFHLDHARVEFCDANGEVEWERVIMR